ncbi:MAG: signal peptide peptidase SppA, partial [Nitrospirales bacterium]|nr:signal peptide peptidase SppA [Nitrospirales bacterium]
MKAKRVCLFVFLSFIVLVAVSALLTFFQSYATFGSGRVALVRIEGAITESEFLIDEIRGYRKDDSIRAIVLRVDSPGGEVVASQEIYEEVKKAAACKKVIVSMGSMAASGGYYVAVPAAKIVANPASVTGSIGVIMETPNLKGLMEKVGVKAEVVKSGRFKDMASYFKEMGSEERAVLQGVMDDLHGQFIQAVSEGRKIPLSKVKEMADGRIFSGAQALKLGLVDKLGTLQDAIALAGREAGIEGEPEVVTREEKTS